ncbi:hypothetical protein [Streptomyces sp. NPDC005547]
MSRKIARTSDGTPASSSATPLSSPCTTTGVLPGAAERAAARA